MRLDKFFSEMGILSRKECAVAAKRGRITLDGKPVTRADVHIDPENSTVTLDGERVGYEKYLYIMLDKPAGVLSATEDKRQSTVLDLLEDRHRKLELFPCGRLDKDTTGFLLMTNDGDLAHRLLSPRYHVEKTYAYTLRDPLSVSDALRIEAGVDIGEKNITAPAKVESTGENEGLITITEGKFHQIKRMFAAVGNEVTALRRVRFGGIDIDPDLGPGGYRELSDSEIETLRSKGEKND
ncbi:MAG: rRNA pseudouridine synthase [Clostridia bacterium]|nr:rRNA pseudouridine synthase [Clostridia bacterium]